MPKPQPPIRVWSRQYSIAKGWYWESERICSDETANAWLNAFRKNEPDHLFILARTEPTDQQEVPHVL